MLKAIVWCTRKDVVTSPKLFQISKPLELWRINYSHTQWVEFNVAMNWITEHLQTAIRDNIIQTIAMKTFEAKNSNEPLHRQKALE